MTAPLKIIATLTTAPDVRNDVGRAMKRLVTQSQAEPGCLQYDFYEINPEGFEDVPKTGGDFVVIESWKNAEALESHASSDHFQAFIGLFPKDKLMISVQVLASQS